MISCKGEPKLNVIFTPKGLERVSILGGVNLTLEAMELYRTIAGDVMEIDKKIRKSATGKRPIKVLEKIIRGNIKSGFDKCTVRRKQ